MRYFIDGYTIRGNPSAVGGGYSIFDEFSVKRAHERIRRPAFTNNEAEILAIKHCLELCMVGDEILTDSMNNVYWCRNGFSKTRHDLNSMLLEIKHLIMRKQVTISWVPREKNVAGWYNEECEK